MWRHFGNFLAHSPNSRQDFATCANVHVVRGWYTVLLEVQPTIASAALLLAREITMRVLGILTVLPRAKIVNQLHGLLLLRHRSVFGP